MAERIICFLLMVAILVNLSVPIPDRGSITKVSETYYSTSADIKNEVRVTFIGNGGVSEYTTATYQQGKVDRLPDASSGDNKFLGWYTEREGGTKVDVGSVLTSDATLYARWEVVSYSYNIVVVGERNLEYYQSKEESKLIYNDKHVYINEGSLFDENDEVVNITSLNFTMESSGYSKPKFYSDFACTKLIKYMSDIDDVSHTVYMNAEDVSFNLKICVDFGGATVIDIHGLKRMFSSVRKKRENVYEVTFNKMDEVEKIAKLSSLKLKKSKGYISCIQVVNDSGEKQNVLDNPIKIKDIKNGSTIVYKWKKIKKVKGFKVSKKGKVTFRKLKGASCYCIYYKKIGTSKWKSKIITKNSVRLNNLKSGKTYQVKVSPMYNYKKGKLQTEGICTKIKKIKIR
jgi:hypothetical protein